MLSHGIHSSKVPLYSIMSLLSSMLHLCWPIEIWYLYLPMNSYIYLWVGVFPGYYDSMTGWEGGREREREGEVHTCMQHKHVFTMSCKFLLQYSSVDSSAEAHPHIDYTPPHYITLLFTDLGVLTPSAVSDELIKLYQWSSVLGLLHRVLYTVFATIMTVSFMFAAFVLRGLQFAHKTILCFI